MPKVRNQHIIPQFLQKNFSIDKEKKKVKIYETPLNPKHQSSIKDASIKHNMSSEYTYGPSQFGESLLSHLEFEASKEIKKMINSPKKYMRQHPKLPDSMINFMVSLQLRGTHNQTFIKQLTTDFKLLMDNNLSLTKEENDAYEQFQSEHIDTNEFFGSTLKDIKKRREDLPEIYNGRYQLVTSDVYAFLPDNIVTWFLPLTPHLILVIGDFEELPTYISMRSTSWFFEFYNYLALQRMNERIIVSQDTTLSYILKLILKFGHIGSMPNVPEYEFVWTDDTEDDTEVNNKPTTM